MYKPLHYKLLEASGLTDQQVPSSQLYPPSDNLGNIATTVGLFLMQLVEQPDPDAITITYEDSKFVYNWSDQRWQEIDIRPFNVQPSDGAQEQLLQLYMGNFVEGQYSRQIPIHRCQALKLCISEETDVSPTEI